MSDGYITAKKYYEDMLADSKVLDARDAVLKDEIWGLRMGLIIIGILAGINAANVVYPLLLHTLGI